MQTVEHKNKIYRKYKNGYYSRIERVHFHRVIWEENYGEIPVGFCIHHKDGNKENNNITNLECISRKHHAKLHWESGGEIRKEKVRENIKKAQLWRSTKEGREYSAAHHKKLWKKAKLYSRVCTVCGKKFESLSRKKNIYCSALCHSRGYYEKSKETRVCIICNGSFEAYKYAQTCTCSRKCTWIKANQSRKKTTEMRQKERLEKLLK
jgi:HNH endonuclease